MKWIVGDFFARSPVLVGPLFALVLFVLVFSLAALRALRSHKELNARLASHPLEEDGRHD